MKSFLLNFSFSFNIQYIKILNIRKYLPSPSKESCKHNIIYNFCIINLNKHSKYFIETLKPIIHNRCQITNKLVSFCIFFSSYVFTQGDVCTMHIYISQLSKMTILLSVFNKKKRCSPFISPEHLTKSFKRLNECFSTSY